MSSSISDSFHSCAEAKSKGDGDLEGDGVVFSEITDGGGRF